MTLSEAPLQALSTEPVQGLSLSGVSILRLDRVGGPAPGNKRFKLEAILRHAGFAGGAVLSFGGAWSNHLHALAGLGALRGFPTIGVVRGEPPARPSAALQEMQGWGMRLHFVSRTEYRRRGDVNWQRQLQREFGAELVLPEGGATVAGALGCRGIGEQLRRRLPPHALCLVAVGTGTTLAGIAMGLGPGRELLGISALRGAYDLESRVARWVGDRPAAAWRISHDDHCGGFARSDAGLREFMLAFERAQAIPLEPVYTGKVMYALHRRLAAGEWQSGRPVVVIHTGGLQGRRGFDWLSPAAGASHLAP